MLLVVWVIMIMTWRIHYTILGQYYKMISGRTLSVNHYTKNTKEEKL